MPTLFARYWLFFLSPRDTKKKSPQLPQSMCFLPHIIPIKWALKYFLPATSHYIQQEKLKTSLPSIFYSLKYIMPSQSVFIFPLYETKKPRTLPRTQTPTFYPVQLYGFYICHNFPRSLVLFPVTLSHFGTPLCRVHLGSPCTQPTVQGCVQV